MSKIIRNLVKFLKSCGEFLIYEKIGLITKVSASLFIIGCKVKKQYGIESRKVNFKL